MHYATQDTRMAAYFMLKEMPFLGTETKHQNDDDRVYLMFDIPENTLVELKRDFFEGGQVPALLYANFLKQTMHVVREARELAREQ
jgi:hypothetical protein